MKKFSLLYNFEKNLITLEEIYNSIKITLGPTGKNGIVFTKNNELKFLTNGSNLLKSLEFSESGSNILLKLLEQSAIKTIATTGDGSTTITLLNCKLLQICLKFIINGYNAISLSIGLKKLAYFLIEKVTEYSFPVENQFEIEGVFKTATGKKLNSHISEMVKKSIPQIRRDGLTIIEENFSSENEIEIVEGIQIEKGYASSYFINELKNFEVVYENPYILISGQPITLLNQIKEIIEYVKSNNKPLVIIAEEINKEVLSTLILNFIQKKLKVVVIKYTAIKFLKNGILEDLATLTHSNYFIPTSKENIHYLSIDDLGQAEKVIIKKDKSTFLLSKFSKVIAKRRINELNRELLTAESEDEKSLFKSRIARLSGNINKIKIGISNQYEIVEQRQKVENAIITIHSALEEGVLPGGGSFYLYLRQELVNWSSLNLIGEEIFASNILSEALLNPFQELLNNANISYPFIFENLKSKLFPTRYDLIEKKYLNKLEEGILDSAKSVRSILWNSLTLVATIITTE